MQKHILSLFLLFGSMANAQTVVPAGAGSYASAPPASLGAAVTTFANMDLNVPVGNTRPIPTNDWWSNILMPKTPNNFAGNLHAYPVTIVPQNYGCDLIFPINWVNQDMVKDFPLRIKGTGFAPAKNIAKDWNDWGLMVNLQDGTKSMDITMGNGMPMAWFETSGFNPFIEFGNNTIFFDDAGVAINFPFTGNHFGAFYGGRYYGIYAPNNTVFSRTGNNITITNSLTQNYFTIATLKSMPDLTYYQTFAYSIPRDTKVSWVYSPTNAKIDVTWTIITQNLKGEAEQRIIQGFNPHHYKDCTTDFNFIAQSYATPRGLMKCAVGNIFKFTYDFNGVLAHTPVPTVQNVPNPYSPTKMAERLDNFATLNQFGNDTYWGGKNLLNAAKYTLMANSTNNANLNTIKTKSRNALIDWLTYTPGETSKFFARYDKWKALVGFSPSYGSEQFTDNHFHYGYLIHAAALQGMLDKPFLDQYAPMLKLIVKQYANWERNDNQFPFLRTFSPWKGFSYAGGTSSPDGNNQESSSEAINAWAGMFLLGDLLGDNGMRDAAAFGYLSESRAIKEYWLDVDDENIPATFPHSMVGIVFENGMSYGTWFSARPIHIHGIQWLPWSPVFNHLAKYPAYLQQDYAIMKAEEQTTQGASDESNFGADWGNVALAYEQMYNPAYVAQRLDEYWAAPANSAYNNMTKDVTTGQTYYYTHSHRTMGEIQWNYHTSAPNSQVYFNASTNTYTYTGFNAKLTAQDVIVYKDGLSIGKITVPAYSFFTTTQLDAVVLPVTLLNFTGAKKNNINLLQWSVANAVNFQSFALQKQDGGGIGFTAIATLPYQNNINNYSYTDDKASADSYYRLAMINTDGSVSYSSIVFIKGGLNKFTITKIYPVPATNALNVSLYAPVLSSITYSIVDMHGSVIQELQHTANGNATKQIDITALPKGTYVLKIMEQSGSVVIKKFTKQ